MDNLVSKSTQEALMEFVKQCFAMNRFLDRAVSVLGVKFAMNQLADLVHHGLAHAYPNLGDICGEKCLEAYNISVIYGETPKGDEDYSTVSECIRAINKRTIDFQTLTMGVCKIAYNNNDLQVYADMLDILKKVNEYVTQTILLEDKIEVYGNNIAAYDHDVKDFWILKEAY